MAHTDLDAAVLAAYGFSAKADLLAQLLALNRAVAARLERAEPVTAPGVPPGFPRLGPPRHRRLHPAAALVCELYGLTDDEIALVEGNA